MDKLPQQYHKLSQLVVSQVGTSCDTIYFNEEFHCSVFDEGIEEILKS